MERAHEEDMKRLSFDEIFDADQFEDLTAAYFRLLHNEHNAVKEILVDQSGKGIDGGVDVSIKIKVNDGLINFNRVWIIQCKFYEGPVSPSKLASINIPSLVHSHNAVGYLLVCKNGVTSGVTDLFKNLNRDCKFGYAYKIWKGDEFLKRIRYHQSLLESYFPEFWVAYQKLKDQ